MELTYPMRQLLRRQVGIKGAAVLDVLAHHGAGTGAGVEITTELLASEAAMSAKTARRTITALRDAGLVKCESRFRDNRQVANHYRLDFDRIGASQLDSPGGQGDQAIGSTTNQVVVDELVLTNSLKSSVMPRESLPETAGEGLRPSVAETPPGQDSGTMPREKHWTGAVEPHADAGEADVAGALPIYLWPPRNSPMPMPVGSKHPGGKSVMGIWNNAAWLVSYFEGYVVDKTNHENATKGRKPVDEVSESRKVKWFDNAWELVSGHPLPEVVEVIDWLFNTQAGHLPTWIAKHSKYRSDTKVTRIRQIQEHYDLLLKAMHSGAGPDDSVAGDTASPRAKITSYGSPFIDPAAEAKVTDLIELFTEFRLTVGPTKNFHHKMIWRWAKSFRIMLVHRRYDFDEVKMVVTTLRDHPEMDRIRYHDPFDMYQHGEWEHLVSAAKLARLRAERRPTRVPAPNRNSLEPSLGLRWDNTDESDAGSRSLDVTSRPRRPTGYYSRNRTSRDAVS